MNAASVIRKDWVHPRARSRKKLGEKGNRGSTVWVRKDKGTRFHLLSIDNQNIGCGLKYDEDLYSVCNVSSPNNVVFCKTCWKKAGFGS